MKQTMSPNARAEPTHIGNLAASTNIHDTTGQQTSERVEESTLNNPPATAPATSQPFVTSTGEILLPSDFGKFQLLEEVGAGGMGVVYKAMERGLDRVVALKMIRTDGSVSATLLERFRREAAAASRFDHPGIVPLFEFGEQDGCPFYTMPYIDGLNLKQWVTQQGLPTQSEAIRIAALLAEAVAHAHQRGIVHRDLKPANVMLDSSGRPRILDFGLAKSLNDKTALSTPGSPVGTPEFMSPEQVSGESEQIGPATDIHALGSILYFLLTGKPPYTATSLVGLLLKVRDPEQPPAPPSLLQPEVGELVEGICLQCLRKDPRWRYPSAESLAHDLNTLRQPPSTAVVTAPPRVVAPAVVSPAPTPPGSSRRRRIGIFCALAVAVAGLALGGWPYYSTLFSSDDDPSWESMRHDFDLDVSLHTVPDQQRILPKNEIHELRSGQELTISVTPGQDCYLCILDVTESGKVIWLFPTNGADANRLFKAGETTVLFDKHGDKLTANRATKPEHFFVSASTARPFPVQQPGPRVANRPVLTNEETAKVFRGLQATPRTGNANGEAQFSEKRLRYRVR